MPSTIAKIAHISDLHCGWRFWPPYLSTSLANHLVDHICSQHPHLVICTGDLLNGPLSLYAWHRARKILKSLEEACGKECAIRLIPGDHDVNILGILNINWLTRITFRKFFGRYLLDENPYYSPELGLTVLGLDTNPTFLKSVRQRFRLGILAPLPHGEVSEEAIKRFARTVSDFRSKHGTPFSNSFKIVAIHDYPVPNPCSGSDATLMFRSVGPLLVELARYKTDLLLHGNTHSPGYYRLTICFHDHDSKIAVLCAGRLKADKSAKNSYNLIAIRSDGEVSAQVFRLGYDETFVPTERHVIVRGAGRAETISEEGSVNS